MKKKLTLLKAPPVESQELYDNVFEKLLQETRARQRAERVLRTIAEGISGATGKNFFLSLVKYLSKVLEMDYVLVGKLVGETKTTIQTIAVCADDNIIDNFQYGLAQTPCLRTIQKNKCLLPINVHKLFPAMPFNSKAGKIESYFGVLLADTDGDAIGLLALLKTSTITPSAVDSSVLQVFAIRAAAELERQQQEEELLKARSLESVGRMAAGVAHEINNPLANASLNIQRLKKKLATQTLDPAITNKLESAERNIDKASTIARELLLFSRQSDLKLEPVNLGQIIRHALSALTYDLEKISINYNFSEIPDVPGDVLRLEGLFINIFNNAIEAMPEGGCIDINAFQTEGSLSIKVSDNGAGIPDEILPRVFDPFFTTKEVGKGTGLGLAICYGTAKQLNGSMAISSSVGKGTTVTLTLPFYQ